tara:strand:+ start:2071 stop:2415 length:345 start_codon:yes stop_codon:yes gene_type:complete
MLAVTEIEMCKMNEIEKSRAAEAAANGRVYVESLLAKYPSTSDDEKEAILDFLTNVSALDAALLTCNETISEKLKAFRYDHRKQLGFTSRNWVGLAVLLGLVALAIYLLWDFGI